MASRRQQFGGPWTEKKLQVLSKYLSAYKMALKKQKFSLVYIDAFAGSGERIEAEDPQGQLLLDEAQSVFQGSAHIALQLDFDEYIFIEQNQAHVERLRAMQSAYKYPERITVIHGDANVELQRICREHGWRNWAGVLFLDPYGMQVNWSTMEAVARTGALDVWLLVPLGIAINRLLPNSGAIRDNWKEALTRFFGNEDWHEAAYRIEEPSQSDQTFLFDPPELTLRRRTLDNIENFFISRLAEIFGFVLRETLHLENTRGDWMYSFCFMMASRNKAAHNLGHNIAGYIIRGMRQ